MKITQKEYKDAIQEVANAIGFGSGYVHMIEHGNLPQLTKQIVYDIFVHEFVPTESTQKNIDLFREYSKELDKNGFVEFVKY